MKSRLGWTFYAVVKSHECGHAHHIDISFLAPGTALLMLGIMKRLRIGPCISGLEGDVALYLDGRSVYRCQLPRFWPTVRLHWYRLKRWAGVRR